MQQSSLNQGENENHAEDNPALNKIIERNIRTETKPEDVLAEIEHLHQRSLSSKKPNFMGQSPTEHGATAGHTSAALR